MRSYWIVALGFLLLTASCSKLPTHAYEIEVTVTTPEGQRSGSGIIEISAQRQLQVLPDTRPIKSTIHGEAVPIFLPNGRVLFALLRHQNGRYPNHLAQSTLQGPDRGLEYEERVRRFMAITGPVALEPEQYPILVTFRDLSDPSSLVVFESSGIEEEFGEGYAVKSATVKPSRARAEPRIHDLLPWLRGTHHFTSLSPKFLGIKSPDFVRPIGK